MGNLTTMAVFVWTLNILVFLSQATMLAIAPGESVTLYNCEGTILDEYTAGANCNEIIVPNSENLQNELNPASSNEIEENTGIFFIDIMASVKNWVQNKIDYLAGIAGGPYNLIKAIPGLPDAFVGVIAVFWYAISVLLLLAFIFGRDV